MAQPALGQRQLSETRVVCLKQLTHWLVWASNRGADKVSLPQRPPKGIQRHRPLGLSMLIAVAGRGDDDEMHQGRKVGKAVVPRQGVKAKEVCWGESGTAVLSDENGVPCQLLCPLKMHLQWCSLSRPPQPRDSSRARSAVYYGGRRLGCRPLVQLRGLRLPLRRARLPAPSRPHPAKCQDDRVRGICKALILQKTLDYFSKVLSRTTTALTEEGLGDLLEFLSRFALTKAERLQLVNLLPRTVVEFYLVHHTCNAL